MRFRYTRKELNHMTIYELLRAIISERQSDVTNIYSPLSRRLQHLQKWLDQHKEGIDHIPEEFKEV